MITDSWHTFSNGSGYMLLTRPILARATTDWPRYITTNWPQVVPQKHIGAKVSKVFWPPTPPREVCVNPWFLGSISHVAYTHQLWVSDEMRFSIIFLTVFDALRIVEPSLMKWNRHLMKSNLIIGVKWPALCLHVTNHSRSHKRHNEGKKFWVVIINFLPILEQCHLIILIVVYAFMRHCSLQICLHIHPISLSVGLTAPIWKCMSGIGDHRFTFLMDLLSNYTFYTNLTLFPITRFLIEDVTSLIVFNLWKVEKIMQHRLMPV